MAKRKAVSILNPNTTQIMNPKGHPFGPTKVIDDAFLSIAAMVAVVLCTDAVPPGRAPCPAVEVPVCVSGNIVDPAVLDKVKVGDKVDITWNTDVTVAVQ